MSKGGFFHFSNSSRQNRPKRVLSTATTDMVHDKYNNQGPDFDANRIFFSTIIDKVKKKIKRLPKILVGGYRRLQFRRYPYGRLRGKTTRVVFFEIVRGSGATKNCGISFLDSRFWNRCSQRCIYIFIYLEPRSEKNVMNPGPIDCRSSSLPPIYLAS